MKRAIRQRTARQRCVKLWSTRENDLSYAVDEVIVSNGAQDDVRRFCAAFEERRDLVVDRIAQIDGMTLDPPRRAFYGLIGCTDLIGAQTPNNETLSHDAEITVYILKDTGIAVVLGSAYELSPFSASLRPHP